jgi:hypothetical protein
MHHSATPSKGIAVFGHETDHFQRICGPFVPLSVQQACCFP